MTLKKLIENTYPVLEKLYFMLAEQKEWYVITVKDLEKDLSRRVFDMEVSEWVMNYDEFGSAYIKIFQLVNLSDIEG